MFCFIEHHEPDIQIRMVLMDSAGFRAFELKGKTDGKVWPQMIDGRPESFISEWDGDRWSR